MEENRQEEILEEAAAQADAAEAEEVIDDTQETEESAASEMEEMQEDSEEQDDQKKRSLFGKKKKDKRDVQIEELTDRVQRQMAEFDNFRKRSEKEKAAMYEVGAKSVIEKILPTIDNFERGFAGLTEEQKEDAFVQGMEKVYRQMLTTLESIGAGENIIVEEFQKGYLYRDSIVRHSMVKVAN